MTHDELVSAIKKGIVMTGNRLASHEEGANLYRRTVLAVVELHKPYREESYWAEGLGSRPQDFCSVCIRASKNAWSTYPDTALPVYYPCPTIQAIEKELA